MKQGSETTCCICERSKDLSIDPQTNRFRCELRPYGPGRQPICFQCAHSSTARTHEVEERMRKALEGDVHLTMNGPVPLKFLKE